MEIDGFVIQKRLGRGVYADVYQATRPNRGYGWACALKVLHEDYRNDDWVCECFRREGSIGKIVRHPSLISIQETHTHFHICTLVPGHTLRDAALLPIPIVLSALEQIASALAALHRVGYVHGDVKPGNIMLAPDGQATLIDLGFARRPGTLPYGEGLPGTPNYLAPEMCRRDFIDTPAADVFALGISAFELLTGDLPYERLHDNAEVLQQHRVIEPRSLRNVDDTIPRWVVNLVDEMLRPNPFERIKARPIQAIIEQHSHAQRKAA
jgi:serine/threonine-protein kinase